VSAAGAVQIREGDFAAFFEAPFACYGDDHPYVSPLKGDLRKSLGATNPLFRDFAQHTLFTAHRDGRIVGRILAHIHDASNRTHGLSRGYFGWFDCIDDDAVAAALLGAAAGWVRGRGCTELAGNFNLTITQVIGVVTEGFDEAAYTYQQANPPHVARLLENLGFKPFFPMRTFEADVSAIDPAALLGPAQHALLADPRWRFAPIRRRGFEDSLRGACGVLNDGFARNSLFVPLTEEEFLFPCDGMMWIIDETLSWMAFHDDQPAGVVLCIPDLNPFLRATRSRIGLTTPWHLWKLKRHRDRAAIIFFSIRAQHHNRGVNGVLLHKLVGALRAGGYRRLGVSWITDGNAASLRQMEKLRARPLHRLHLFRKALA
jgi:GNAT superfamily N-acetyltransferase